MKRFDSLVTLGVPGDLHREVQLVADQPQVIGTDALITVAITGDIDRLVVCDRNADPKYLALVEPGTVLIFERQIRGNHKRGCQ